MDADRKLGNDNYVLLQTRACECIVVTRMTCSFVILYYSGKSGYQNSVINLPQGIYHNIDINSPPSIYQKWRRHQFTTKVTEIVSLFTTKGIYHNSVINYHNVILKFCSKSGSIMQVMFTTLLLKFGLTLFK